MAIVIHTINGKLYAYEHYRVGDKIVSEYLYPVDSLGAPKTKKHIEARRKVEIKKAIEQLKAFDKPILSYKQEEKTRLKLEKYIDKIEKNKKAKRDKITKFGEHRKKFDKTANILEPEHFLTTKKEKVDFTKNRDKYQRHLENTSDKLGKEAKVIKLFLDKYTK